MTNKKYSITDLLQGLIVGAAIALLIANVYHSMKTCEKKAPDTLERHLESFDGRLKRSEALLLKTNSLMDITLKEIQRKVKQLDSNTIKNIVHHSEDEAIRLALLLEKMPAIPMPYYEESYSSSGGSSSSKYEGFYGSNFNYTDDFFLANRSSRTDDKEWSAKEAYFEYGYEKDKKSEPLLSDVEAHKICNEWKETYQVQVGVGWGLLPYDLQKKWLEYSCDYHLN